MSNIEALIAQAEKEWTTGNSEAGWKILNTAAKQGPDHPAVRLYIGVALNGLNDCEKAVEEFEAAINIYSKGGVADQGRIANTTSERLALAYWGRSYAYFVLESLYPEDKAILDRSLDDEITALRIWVGDAMYGSHYSREFETALSPRDAHHFLHQFLATSRWGEWAENEGGTSNTNTKLHYRRGDFDSSGWPKRQEISFYEHQLHTLKHIRDPRIACFNRIPAYLEVTTRQESDGTQVKMKFQETLPNPEISLGLHLATLGLASSLASGTLRHARRCRERLRSIASVCFQAESVACEEYLNRVSHGRKAVK